VLDFRAIAGPVARRIKDGQRPDAAGALLQGSGKRRRIFGQSVDRTHSGDNHPFHSHMMSQRIPDLTATVKTTPVLISGYTYKSSESITRET